MRPLDSWIVVPKPNCAAKVRLYCFPYAGGSAHVFHRWPDAIPEAEVCMIQLPGRGSRLREACLTRVEEAVEGIASAIRFDQPFAFFGHSMGALIGFELARSLRRKGLAQPSHLFVSGRSAPDWVSRKPPISGLPEAEFREALRKLNGTPEAVLHSQELMDLMAPTLRADFGICERYKYTPEEPLCCPISVFGGSEDHRCHLESLEQWRSHSRREFSVTIMPGNHFFLHSAEGRVIEIVAAAMRRMAAPVPLVRWPIAQTQIG